MNKIRVEKKIGKNILSFETGQLAKQSAGCILTQYGETVVLSAAASSAPRPGLDFFPLMCDYRERMAAAGKFPGGFLKREGRPTMKETLTARLTDRPIRPLWPKGYKEEVQIQSFVLSSDGQNDGDVLAMNGAGCALQVSPLPFQGPVASVRIGKIDGELVPFPSVEDLDESELDLIVSGTQEAVTMIEGFAQEMPEDDMVEAIVFAHQVIREICDMQVELAEKVQPQKIEYTPPEDDGLLDRLKSAYYDEFKAAKQTAGKQERADACSALKERAKSEIIPDPDADGAVCSKRFGHEWHELESILVRELILAGTRPDGRDHTSLRPIYCETDLLPRTHGSALFQRGETQSLITIALGTGCPNQPIPGGRSLTIIHGRGGSRT